MNPARLYFPRRRTASALIVVLWVIGLLAIIVSSFAFDMHLESIITSYCRKRLKADYLAQSGLEMVKVVVLKKDKITGDQETDTEDATDSWYPLARALKYGGSVSGFRQSLGDGEIVIDIIPEPARRNINKLDEKDWEGVLEVADIPEDMWDSLIDCFFDWTDSETPTVVRPFGAETDDYYARLPTPYKAHNGPIETIDELLLIKGFTNTVVYGGQPPEAVPEDPPWLGIADLLTTYGDGLVNVNAASKRVLRTLPDVDDTLADLILEERAETITLGGKDEDRHYKSPEDFFARIPEATRNNLASRISVSSAIYRINSTGFVQGVRRTISCVVEFNGGAMNILQWQEHEGE
jgi:general secretion pathway protein K